MNIQKLRLTLILIFTLSAFSHLKANMERLIRSREDGVISQVSLSLSIIVFLSNGLKVLKFITSTLIFNSF